MSGKRTAHERFPEVLEAAVRVFARDGYRSARMSDVAREAGLSEAALYRYVDGKEGLFALAIRHALLLEPFPVAGLPGEDDPGGGFPLKAPPLAEMIRQAREFVAAEVPFGTLAEAMGTPSPADPAAELESVLRELFSLEELTNRAADMIERSARELPELADLLNSGLRAPVIAALTSYLDNRAATGALRATPDSAATARLVLETLTWFARHRFSDPYGAAIPARLARDTAVDALVHALVPPRHLASWRLSTQDVAIEELVGPDAPGPLVAEYSLEEHSLDERSPDERSPEEHSPQRRGLNEHSLKERSLVEQHREEQYLGEGP